VKVFISSVRRGLEAERDALPGLIEALGHEPKRFEDYSAMSVPSRQACLDGVRDADVYLLVLGGIYGDPLADTGIAPTEEEFVAARTRGIPVLVFLKRGGTPDDQQQAFIARVSGYVDGRFRKGFADVAELLTAVAGSIRELEARPPVLAWTALTAQVDVPWREADSNTFGFTGTELETYLMPVGPTNHLLATVLVGLPERLGRAGRDGGLFAQDGALSLHSTDEEAVAAARRESRATDAGIRIRRDRSVAVWEQLPTDMLGAIVDEQDLAARIATALRLAGGLALIETEQVALAVGLRIGTTTTIGNAADLGHRSSAQPIGFGGGQKSARVGARDSVPTAAIAPAAAEVAGELAKRLMFKVREIR
jgi:Domain of unknown function (DUF4062)